MFSIYEYFNRLCFVSYLVLFLCLKIKDLCNIIINFLTFFLSYFSFFISSLCFLLVYMYSPFLKVFLFFLHFYFYFYFHYLFSILIRSGLRIYGFSGRKSYLFSGDFLFYCCFISYLTLFCLS